MIMINKNFKQFLRRLGFNNTDDSYEKEYGEEHSSLPSPKYGCISIDEEHINIRYPMYDFDFVGSGWDTHLLKLQDDPAKNIKIFTECKEVMNQMNKDVDKILNYLKSHENVVEELSYFF